MRLVFLGFFLIFSFPLQSANAEKLCVTRRVSPLPNGQIPMGRNVNAATVCAAEEREILDTATFRGPIGPSGPVGPQGPQGAPGTAVAQLSIYDSNDALVGAVLGMNCQNFHPGYQRIFDTVITSFQRDGRTYLICLSRDGVIPNATVYYTTPDCTGAGFADESEARFPVSDGSFFTPSLVLNRGGQRVLFRPDYSTGLQTILVRSYSEWDGSCYTNAAFSQPVRPLIEEVNLSAILVAPFAMR